MIVALNLSTPLVAAVPGIWMAFVLAFSGHDRWRTENRTVALAAPPFVWVLTAWSSGDPRARDARWQPSSRGRSRCSRSGSGSRMWRSYCTPTGCVSPVSSSWSICTGRTGNRYRLQTFVILLGTLFPFLGGIVTVVDVGSYAHLAWFPAGSWSTASSCTGPSSGSGRSTPPSSRARHGRRGDGPRDRRRL